MLLNGGNGFSPGSMSDPADLETLKGFTQESHWGPCQRCPSSLWLPSDDGFCLNIAALMASGQKDVLLIRTALVSVGVVNIVYTLAIKTSNITKFTK